MRYVLGVPVLTGVHAAVLGAAAIWDLALGAAVATAVLTLLPRPSRGAAGRSAGARAFVLVRRLAAAPLFMAVIARDTATGAVRVGITVFFLRRLRRPGIVRVPIGDRSPRGLALETLTLTLAPGSLLVDIDEERQEMLLHVMDASDPDRIRAQVQRKYRRWQRRVLP